MSSVEQSTSLPGSSTHSAVNTGRVTSYIEDMPAPDNPAEDRDKNHFGTPSECSSCNICFNTSADLREHIRDDHHINLDDVEDFDAQSSYSEEVIGDEESFEKNKHVSSDSDSSASKHLECEKQQDFNTLETENETDSDIQDIGNNIRDKGKKLNSTSSSKKLTSIAKRPRAIKKKFPKPSAVVKANEKLPQEKAEILIKYFIHTKYPSAADQLELAEEIGTTRKRINKWFSGRRYRLKKTNKLKGKLYSHYKNKYSKQKGLKKQKTTAKVTKKNVYNFRNKRNVNPIKSKKKDVLHKEFRSSSEKKKNTRTKYYEDVPYDSLSPEKKELIVEIVKKVGHENSLSQLTCIVLKKLKFSTLYYRSAKKWTAETVARHSSNKSKNFNEKCRTSSTRSLRNISLHGSGKAERSPVISRNISNISNKSCEKSVISKECEKKLEQYLKERDNPTPAEIELLAEKMHLSKETVVEWFDNKLSKCLILSSADESDDCYIIESTTYTRDKNDQPRKTLNATTDCVKQEIIENNISTGMVHQRETMATVAATPSTSYDAPMLSPIATRSSDNTPRGLSDFLQSKLELMVHSFPNPSLNDMKIMSMLLDVSCEEIVKWYTQNDARTVIPSGFHIH